MEQRPLPITGFDAEFNLVLGRGAGGVHGSYRGISIPPRHLILGIGRLKEIDELLLVIAGVHDPGEGKLLLIAEASGGGGLKFRSG